MDPLASAIACDCLAGYAQRDYPALETYLARSLRRPVKVYYAEELESGLEQVAGDRWLAIGKDSLVRHDSADLDLKLEPLARLTGLDGTTTLTGLFVARKDGEITTLKDLDGRSIMLGPEGHVEKTDLAVAALSEQDIRLPASPLRAADCTAAAIAVVDGDVDAAAVSSYALPLVEGCGAIRPGLLKVVGKTDPAPFIVVFASAGMSRTEKADVREALAGVSRKRSLKKKMESRSGFEIVPPPEQPTSGWTDWRGEGRTAVSVDVPETLPETAHLFWRFPTQGTALAGVCADAHSVIIADKSTDGTRDIFRCLDASDGKPRWSLEYEAPGEMDFTNAPRATPVIHGDRVLLLGAWGHLHCLDLATGDILWKRHLVKEFGAELQTWGMTATPLVVDDLVVVNPGAPDASLAALELDTGKTAWTSPGELAAYASFICAELGGRRQLVGYDQTTLGGWDPATGRRLWSLTPDIPGDFNVPTPMALDGRLIVSTENNGTRVYAFEKDGRIRPEPVAQNDDLAPDTSTPVMLDGLVVGCAGALWGLDLGEDLKPRFTLDDPAFEDYIALLAGNHRVLILSAAGELLLLDLTPPATSPTLTRLRLFEDEPDIWAHPALVGDQIYIRAPDALYCFAL